MTSHPLDTPARQRDLPPTTTSTGFTSETHDASNHSRPEPRSSYYTGPPSRNSAFGTAPAGQVGRDKPREIVRIERDYSVSPSHIPQFYPSFPLELESRITPTQFSDLINDINTILIQANDPKWAAVDNGMAIVTLWISPWIAGSHYQRKMKEFARVLQQFNTQTLNPAGLHLRHPDKNAWLYLEMEYY